MRSGIPSATLPVRLECWRLCVKFQENLKRNQPFPTGEFIEEVGVWLQAQLNTLAPVSNSSWEARWGGEVRGRNMSRMLSATSNRKLSQEWLKQHGLFHWIRSLEIAGSKVRTVARRHPQGLRYFRLSSLSYLKDQPWLHSWPRDQCSSSTCGLLMWQPGWFFCSECR